MGSLLRRVGTRAGISVSLVVLIAAVVIVARLAAGGGSTPGSYVQPDPNIPSAGPSAGDDGQVALPTSAAPDDEPVRTAATTFTQAWLRSTISPAEWHAALEPLSTPSLAQSLNGVDPVGVPATRIVGSPVVTLQSDIYAQVTVPVDSGTVELGLLRQGELWLVDSLDWQRT